MKFWLSKSSAVPVREQFATQIMLGIVSGDLRPAERLPSTRELARRLQIHSNTVSAVYRELAEGGWADFKKGSGVYVRASKADAELDTNLQLDQLISSFLQTARARGFSLSDIQQRVKQWLELQPPERFLVIEPDAELRRILIVEIEAATGFPTVGVGPARCTAADLLGSIVVALYGQIGAARRALPPDTTLLVLNSRSIPEALRGHTLPPAEALIAVASRWPEFLRWTRTVLVAAGVDSNALNFRDARERHWHQGLRASAFVIADALTAQSLPANCPARIFHIISDNSLDELRAFVKRFLRSDK